MQNPMKHSFCHHIPVISPIYAKVIGGETLPGGLETGTQILVLGHNQKCPCLCPHKRLQNPEWLGVFSPGLLFFFVIIPFVQLLLSFSHLEAVHGPVTGTIPVLRMSRTTGLTRTFSTSHPEEPYESIDNNTHW